MYELSNVPFFTAILPYLIHNIYFIYEHLLPQVNFLLRTIVLHYLVFLRAINSKITGAHILLHVFLQSV